jgi:RNA polymerase sigma factor (sigma-70 family)
VSDLAELKLVQSFVGAPSRGECPTLEAKSAWLVFFMSSTKLIRSVLRRCGVRASDVDDLEQQVWIALLRRLGKFETVLAAGGMGEYIRKSAGREASRHLRRRSRRPDGVLTAELESTLLDPGPGPQSEYEWKERQDRARAILAAARASLSDEDHRMLVMRSIDGRTVREIAAAFCVSEECAKKRLQRAIEAIKLIPLRRATL